jgi:quercetin dioxygenase-like cupin family protein
MAGVETSTGNQEYEPAILRPEAPDEIKRFVDFRIDSVEWHPVRFPPDGGPNIPESLQGKVNFEEYYDQGMWTAYVDAGGFSLLGVKLAPDFTIPRHHHNMHQLVFVHEGEAWQGAKRFVPGDWYFTRAGHSYSLTAGPEGVTVFEIRAEPMQNLTLVWDDVDPAKWAHGRRPGGLAESHSKS